MKSSIPSSTYERMLQMLEDKLTPEEILLLQQEVAQDSSLQQALEELRQLYEIGKQADFNFQPFLAGRVMQQIEKEVETKRSSVQELQLAFKQFAIPAFAIMLLLLAFTFIGEQSWSLDTILGTSDLNLEDVYSQYIISL